jgi:hypothetical protein
VIDGEDFQPGVRGTVEEINIPGMVDDEAVVLEDDRPERKAWAGLFNPVDI